MLSKNGRLTPLPETNRIEAMDTAGNLRGVYEVLFEQRAEGETRLVREFVLRYVPAVETYMQLQKLLGIESRKLTATSLDSLQSDGDGVLAALAQQHALEAGVPIDGPESGSQQEAASPEPSRTHRTRGVTMLVNARRNSIVTGGVPAGSVVFVV